MFRMVLATALLLMTATASSAVDAPNSLKGARLGMTLAEFRQLPYPEADKQRDNSAMKTSNYRVHCHGDPMPNESRMMDLMPSRRPGVLTCFHIADTVFVGTTTTLRLAPVGFAGLNASTSLGPIRTVAYRFFPENSPEARLVAIYAEVKSDSFEHLLKTFTERYGKPGAVQEQPVQNRLGARFNNTVVGWQSGEHKVILTRFADDLNTSTVEYLHVSLLDKWHKAVEKTTPKAAKDF